MRKKFYFENLAFFFVFTVLLFSCSFNEETGRRAVLSGEEESVESGASYFDQDENGEFIFSVNERALISPYGKTFWTLADDDEGEAGVFKDFEAEIQKTYGNSSGGFGLVFCQCEDEEWGYCLLTVLLDINGRWCWGKMTDGVFVIKGDWTYSQRLYTGYVKNKVKVTKENGVFNLYLNDIYESSFCDDSEPFIGNGKRGFCAVVTEKENFPDIPVTVIYKMTGGEE